MPIHDWTRVPAGIFHDFHHAWIEEIKRYLNRGKLPPGYYALAEQLASGLGPDVLALHQPVKDLGEPEQLRGGVNIAERIPKVRFHAGNEAESYAAKAKVVVVRHASDHRVIAMIEVVSSGNKSSRSRINSFVRKAEEALAAGIHLMLADLFPPGPRDPEGIHPLIWDGRPDQFAYAAENPLTFAAYIGDPAPQAFVEPAAVGDFLPEMPLFLTTEIYVLVSLETTYQAAWQEFPAVWRKAMVNSG
jgi:Protein of unknown function (DUF4058)